MRKFISALLCGSTLAVAGCSNPAPISGNPVQNIGAVASDVGGTALVSQMTTGIQNADWNLHQAVSVGALTATDPAPSCVDQAEVVLGVTGSPAPSFVPKITDAISLASVGYVYAQQAKTLTGGTLTLSPSCLQVLGQMVLDIQNGINKATVSGVLGAAGISVGIPPLPISLRTAPEANPSLNGR